MRLLLVLIFCTLSISVSASIQEYFNKADKILNQTSSFSSSNSNLLKFMKDYPYAPAYYKALNKFYIKQKALASEVFNQQDKTIEVELYYKEVNEDNVSYEANLLPINISKWLYSKLRENIADSELAFVLPSENYVNESPKEADIIIVLKTDVLFQKQFQTSVTEINLNYQILLPRLYGRTPLKDFYITESFVNVSTNPEMITEKFVKRLEKMYAWSDISTLLDTVVNQTEASEYFKEKLEIDPDDFLAIKLWMLQDWLGVQQYLIEAGNPDGLIKAQLLYPYSDSLNHLIYSKAEDSFELPEKVVLINYLFITQFEGVLPLLNDILSEVDDFEQYKLIGSVLLIAEKYADEETLEYLVSIKDSLFGQEELVDSEFILLLDYVINQVENRI